MNQTSQSLLQSTSITVSPTDFDDNKDIAGIVDIADQGYRAGDIVENGKIAENGDIADNMDIPKCQRPIL